MRVHVGLLGPLPWGMATIRRNPNPSHKIEKPLIQTKIRCATHHSRSGA